jgi:predicted RND superfamily exporter protein
VNTRLARVVVVVLTVASLLLASRLDLSKDLTTLFPRTPEADVLARVTRVFGGGDVAMVLVRGDDPAGVERSANALAEELERAPSVRSVLTRSPSPRPPDPTEAWRFAGPVARDRLAHAVTEDGMRERLRDTHALLLAPGAGEGEALIAKDPLRLAMIPWQDQLEVAAGARGAAGEAFVADGGKTRLVVIEPRGRAFAPDEAARFTRDARDAIAVVAAKEPGVRFDLTGGHVVARETEALLRGDLTKSSVVSVVLASLVFLVTFRRARALVAVLPPLAAGTLWTTAIAALVYPSLSAVATAFAAVVVGVGVDTGVHVYARLLHHRRLGELPAASAVLARRETWKPTLGAAVAAAGAFGCLMMSSIEGMRQLGVLCAAGEVLTAVAILLVVPEVGALLEKGEPPRAIGAGWVLALTKTRVRAVIALLLVVASALPALVMGPLKVEAATGLDARTLPSLATYEAIYASFGGTRGQLVVVSIDRDEDRARQRSDAVAEASDRLVASGAVVGFDALARFAPSLATQRARLAERDRLDLPGRRALFERVLHDEGFEVSELAPALAAFEHPSEETSDVLGLAPQPPAGVLSWLRRRHLARDGGETLSLVYVRAAPGSEDMVRTVLHAADPDGTITGFTTLEADLARALARDLPRVLAGAVVVVVVVLGASLRRISRVALAVLVLVAELAIVAGIARLLGVRWHVYDALVLPVLFGITLDEVLFLIEAVARSGSVEDALREQAPLGTATALTTAAGFGALVVCRFGGLVDVGKVGALGSVVGLVVALVCVPAVYRLRARSAHSQP